MPSKPPPFAGIGPLDVVLYGLVEGRLRLLATIPLDEVDLGLSAGVFSEGASGPLCLPFASIR